MPGAAKITSATRRSASARRSKRSASSPNRSIDVSVSPREISPAAVPYAVNVTNTNYTNGQQVTCTFQVTPPDGAKLGKAVSLTLVEWVTKSVDVEFTFKDVPLP